MKRLLLLGLAVSAAQAQADDCQLSLSQAHLDFGVLNRAVQRNPSAEIQLGERRLSLSLNCPAPADMHVFYRALAATVERYRFTEHGSYRVHASDAVLDGQAVELGLVTGQGQMPTMRGNAIDWRPDHAIVPLRDSLPTTGSSFSVQLQVNAWAQAEATQVRDAVTWEASGLIDAVATGRARELSIQAGFVPAACEANLSNGGIVDFGRMLAKSLNVDKETGLASRNLMLSIGCDGPTRFALRMQDNRKGSATGGTDETAYGLGVDDSRNKIGRYFLYFDPLDLSADALPQVYRTDSTTGGVAWSSSSAYPIHIGNNSLLGFTDTPGSHAGPTAIRNLSGQVSVRAIIAPMNSLDLRTEVLLDGSGTIEIFYP